MKNSQRIAAFALLALVLSGCSGRDEVQVGFQHISVIDDSNIALHAKTGPDAVVSADGQLSIDGKSVAITPPQQALLKQYFTDAITLRNDAVKTGVAGLSTASTAIHSVVTELANGTPDRIAPTVEKSAAKVEAHANLICTDLSALRSTQQALVAQLDAFKPYATIDADSVEDCGQSTVVVRGDQS